MAYEKINKLHERSLRILYKDDSSSFNELLKKDKSVTMHVRNIQLLAIEMYKVNNNLSPSFIVDIFPIKEASYNIREWGTESLCYLGPKIWDLLPDEMKIAPTLESFKLKVKQWDALDCPCRLCKVYISNLGFV